MLVMMKSHLYYDVPNGMIGYVIKEITVDENTDALKRKIGIGSRLYVVRFANGFVENVNPNDCIIIEEIKWKQKKTWKNGFRYV